MLHGIHVGFVVHRDLYTRIPGCGCSSDPSAFGVVGNRTGGGGRGIMIKTTWRYLHSTLCTTVVSHHHHLSRLAAWSETHKLLAGAPMVFETQVCISHTHTHKRLPRKKLTR